MSTRATRGRGTTATRAAAPHTSTSAGWPARTPEGDRKPNTHNHTDEPSTIDYADPTGDQALHYQRNADELDTLRQHWQIVKTSLNFIATRTRRRIPPATPSEPPCYICGDPVEKTGNGNYRGMQQIAGHWVAKPGHKPVCGKHRKQEWRAAS